MPSIRRIAVLLLMFLLVASVFAVAADEQAATPSPTALQFVPLAACRVVDTRNADGPYGGPPITGGSFRSFSMGGSSCHVPLGAQAVSINVTVVPMGGLGYLTVWPTGQDQPTTSLMNSLDGRIKANADIVLTGNQQGSISVYASNTTNVVIDINGYFTPAAEQTLEFYPLTPCRVIDTRGATGELGGPSLVAGTERDFPILRATQCNIPLQGVAVYSLNVTAIPHGILGWLKVWQAGQAEPSTSVLNSLTGTMVANAAIVPAGSGADIAVKPSNDVDIAVDINGYFARPGTGGLQAYFTNPCRTLDTRTASGAFNGELTVDIMDGVCAPPPEAQGYLFNATVVPVVTLPYLTLWADGGSQPVVSTLNAIDGAIASNMAIVPTSNGSIDAFAANSTNLVLDLSGYFAP